MLEISSVVELYNIAETPSLELVFPDIFYAGWCMPRLGQLWRIVEDNLSNGTHIINWLDDLNS